MKKLEFKSIEEELKFYKSVIDSLPALINVNQADNIYDPSSSFNLWSNKQVIDFTGYSREEIDSLGFRFFTETMHPDDMEVISAGLDKFHSDNSPIYGGFIRIRPKSGDYQWFIGSMSILELKDNKPWRIIAVVQNMEQMNDTRNQIIQLIKENLQLKSQLRIHSLSKREKQIVRLIAKGNTDKEIAGILSISPSTAKTHRHNIIQKLQMKNKAALAQFATENGLD